MGPSPTGLGNKECPGNKECVHRAKATQEHAEGNCESQGETPQRGLATPCSQMSSLQTEEPPPAGQASPRAVLGLRQPQQSNAPFCPSLWTLLGLVTLQLPAAGDAQSEGGGRGGAWDQPSSCPEPPGPKERRPWTPPGPRRSPARMELVQAWGGHQGCWGRTWGLAPHL